MLGRPIRSASGVSRPFSRIRRLGAVHAGWFRGRRVGVRGLRFIALRVTGERIHELLHSGRRSRRGAWRRLRSGGLGPRSIRPGSGQIPALPMGRAIGEVVPVPAFSRTWLWPAQAIVGRMHGAIS
jgi:hypothetical protein